MQASSLNNPPLVSSYPEITSPEINSKPSQNNRWTTLFLLCASTFGVYMLSSILLSAQEEVAQHEASITSGIKTRGRGTQKQTIERVTWFIFFIIGLAIYRFGIKVAYRFFMRPCGVGILLLLSTAQLRTYSFYLWGQLLIKGSIHGLWVTQMEMIIKCFKGKELSLAIGIVGSSKVIAGALGTYFYSFISENEMPVLLCFGIVFCLLGDFALNFTKEIYYMTVKEEDERSILEEDMNLKKSTIFVLFISVLCFRVADLSKIVDMSQITQPVEYIFHLVSILPPMVLLPFFAERKRGRIIGVFSSFFMLFIGNMACFLSLDPQIPLFLIPLKAGLCLIEASSWTVLGLWTPRKSRGVFIRGSYTLMCVLAHFCDFLMPHNPMSLFFEFGSVLIVRVGCLVYGWRGGFRRKKREVLKRIKL